MNIGIHDDALVEDDAQNVANVPASFVGVVALIVPSSSQSAVAVGAVSIDNLILINGEGGVAAGCSHSCSNWEGHETGETDLGVGDLVDTQ